MRLLVVGGAGYIGGRLVDFFSNNDTYQLRIASRQKTFQEVSKNFEHVSINWDSSSDLEEICENVDVVIHAAGMNAQDCASDPSSALNVNGVYTARLIRAAVIKRVKRFIYFSTAHVYASPLTGKIVETDCPESLHPYATSHRAAEDMLRYENQQKRIEGIVLRLSNSFGAPMRKEANCWMLFLNDICVQALQQHQIIIHTDGTQQRDFIPLSSVCKATEHIINLPYESTSNGIFNVGAGVSMTLLEMAELMAERIKVITDKQIYISTGPRDSKAAKDLVFSNEKLINTGFKFNFRSSAVEEIDMLIRFCQKNINNLSPVL